MLGQILGGFITIILGVVLAPIIANSVQNGLVTNTTGGVSPVGNATNPSLTGASATIYGLATLFYALSVVVTGVGIATAGLRNAGLM